ncbi:MAG: hypothetical protein Q4B43_10245 [Bacteroidota bacterium]|nr:hypothetical protein [Bacteroidota bacterium]
MNDKKVNKLQDIGRIFENIFDEFTCKVNKGGYVDITKIFFDISQKKWNEYILVNKMLPIKYLNIFNDDKIAFYAECIHTEGILVTSNREQIQIRDRGVFGSDKKDNESSEKKNMTIGDIFEKEKIFDEIYEYSYGNEPILNKELIDYWSKQYQKSFYHSEFITHSLKDENLFKNWLNSLNNAYANEGESDSVTHFFYTIGPVATGSQKMGYEKFIVRANMGFDFSNLEINTLLTTKYFLKALRTFTSRVTNYLIKKYDENETRKQSTRVAITQVFVRNIAHNIVSHVLIHLTTEKAFSVAGIYQLINKSNTYQSDIKLPEINILEKGVSVSEINERIDGMIRLLDWFQDNDKADKDSTLKTTLRSLLNENVKSKAYIENIDTSKKKLQESKIIDEDEVVESSRIKLKKVIEEARDNFIEAFEKISTLFNDKVYNQIQILYPNQQVANLFSYVTNRCLYLNEATYDVSNMVGIKRVYGELFKELDVNRILLNHISAIDNFRYKINFQHNGKKLDDNNDISVSLPADALGAQAFYNIIENIIRNTAKHNNSKTDDVIKFTVNFIDETLNEKEPFYEENKYYRVEIWDDMPIIMDKAKLDKEIENIKKEDKYYEYFGITKDKDDSKTIKGTISSSGGTERKEEPEIKNASDLLVFKQNNRMNNSIINPKDHTLRTNSLGLIEMEASAAFLRQIDISEIESNYYTIYGNNKYYNRIEGKDYPYFIQAFKKEVAKDSYLGYRFYMKKPEKFLIISKNKFAEDKKKQLLNNGITIINRKEFKKSLEGNTPTYYNHEFALLVGEDTSNDSDSPFKFFFESREAKKRQKQMIERTAELSLLPERLMRVDEEFVKCLGEYELKEGMLDDFEKRIWGQWMKPIDKDWNPGDFNIGTTINEGDENKHSLVLFDHFSTRDKEKFSELSDDNKYPYCEPLSSSGQQKLPLFNNLKGQERPLTGYVTNVKNAEDKYVHKLLWEAYDNRVLVIDERVQRFALESYDGYPLIPIFKRMNVIIPDSENDSINLEANIYDNALVKKIEEFIDNEIETSDFMLVHYGVLERMGQEEINKNLKKWGKQTRVIITTGRGKHSLSELPDEVSYVNLSAVLNAFRDNRNKYLINYIINQSRR